jgi:lipopolysaccharide transport system permease protein
MKLLGTFERIYQLALKDLKVRYASTTFGYYWMVLNPLLMLVTLYVVFTHVIDMDVAYYQIFLLLGIVVWNFFSDATGGSISSIASSSSMLKKVRVPLHEIILGAVSSSMIGFMLNILVLIALMFFFEVEVLTPLRIAGIYFLALLFILVIGVSLLISTAYIYFRDVVHMWSYALFMGFWVTPIIYSETRIALPFLKFYMLNPLARIISHLRNTVLYNYLDSLDQILITTSLVLAVALLGVLAYRRYARKYYESL